MLKIDKELALKAAPFFTPSKVAEIHAGILQNQRKAAKELRKKDEILKAKKKDTTADRS